MSAEQRGADRLDRAAAGPSRDAIAQAPELTGKVCLLTGATQGIGRAAAQALCRQGRGLTLVLIARDPARGEQLAAELRAHHRARVELLLGDLSAQAEVRRLAAAFRARHEQLHILINNAGAVFTRRQLSADGIELTWALNHLGYFLLTNLLLDTLQKSAPARIINVASRAHKRVPGIDFADLQSAKNYAGMRVYGQSKLANVLFTRELARRLAGSGVTANCLHPGVVRSGFALNTKSLLNLAYRIMGPFLRTPEQAAADLVYLATAEEVKDVTGAYFIGRRPAPTSRAARDPAAAARLWEVSCKQTGLPTPPPDQ